MSSDHFILAPMRGITDVVYRKVFAECVGGIDRAVAPFVKLRRGHGLTDADRRRLAPDSNQNMPVIPQVNCNHGLAFIDGVKELMDMGYDVVNWNLGCPYPTVSKRRQGAGLLPHPTQIRDILDQVLGACPVQVSVKMRLGFSNPDEFVAVLAVLNDFPLTEVVMHPRTAIQMYGGAVDLERAKQAYELCKHPFVYNGDVVSKEFFDTVRTLFPKASGWMLGRGLLANPLIARELKGETFSDDDRRHLMGIFHDALLSGYKEHSTGDKQMLIRMREHWVYLANGFPNPEAVLRRFKRCKDMEGYERAVNRAFGNDEL